MVKTVMSLGTQRRVVSSSKQPDTPRAGRSRRGYLASLAGAGLVGVAGCLGGDAVRLLSAGSLARTVEEYVGPAFERETGVAVHGEYYGSNAVMRLVASGTEQPDVVVSADATLLRDRLYGEFTDWDAEFASNSLGLGYRGGTSLAGRLDRGVPWYEAVSDTDRGDIAISDPDLDPLGYRAVQAFELAGRAHGLDGFRETMLELVYTEPEEPQLLAGVESGARLAGVVYRNMAVDRGVPFLQFPETYSFGTPELADHYATAEYTTDGGYTARGRPVVYSATVLEDADSDELGRRLVEFLVDSPDLLVEAGLTVAPGLPRLRGTPPAGVSV